MIDKQKLSRRHFLRLMALGMVTGLNGISIPALSRASPSDFISKAIPASKEPLPVIGLGTSRTFNVGEDPQGLDNVTEVMRHFFNAGGTLIDSSPMYGSSQPAIGYALKKLAKENSVFAADKVWTWEHESGPEQMQRSRQYWQVDRFDLMQVHNLVKWQQHLKVLYRMKKQGQIRYVGITTSHGRRHEELEYIMKSEPLDFVQFSYNILDREAETSLLPLAAQRGIAVIINRPFQRGHLIDDLKNKSLPSWASTIACNNWPQFLLKFVISHPAVTCVIPATSQVAHLKENMAAGYGPLPDMAMRRRMIEYVEKII
jgi:diketogulonate reductase-like aldo/keto reductase